MNLIYPGHIPRGQLRVMPETTGLPLVALQAWHLRGIFRDGINRHSGHNLCSIPHLTNCCTNCRTMTIRVAIATGLLAWANRHPTAPHTTPAACSRHFRQQDTVIQGWASPSETVCTSDLHFCGPGPAGGHAVWGPGGAQLWASVSPDVTGALLSFPCRFSTHPAFSPGPVCFYSQHFTHCWAYAAVADAKSLQSCPTLCDPTDGSPPGSSIPGILQARKWSGLPFSSPTHACMLSRFSCVRLCAMPRTAAHQAPLSTEFSRQEYWSGFPNTK